MVASFAISSQGRCLSRMRIGYPHLRSGEDPVFLASVLAVGPAHVDRGGRDLPVSACRIERKASASFAGLQAFLQQARLVKSILLQGTSRGLVARLPAAAAAGCRATDRAFPCPTTSDASARRSGRGFLGSRRRAAPRPVRLSRLWSRRRRDLHPEQAGGAPKARHRRGSAVPSVWGDGGNLLGQREGVHVISDRVAQARLYVSDGTPSWRLTHQKSSTCCTRAGSMAQSWSKLTLPMRRRSAICIAGSATRR